MRGFARNILPMAALAIGASPAHAAAPAPSFALKAVGPSTDGYYRFSATPGAVLHGRVRVVNAGRAAGTVRLSMVDATTGATTGAVYKTVGSRAEDVGGWVRLDTAGVTLPAGGTTVVGFTVTVPAGARRGEHLGGIVAAPEQGTVNDDTAGGRRNFKVTVVNQSVLAVQVDLPGAAREVLKVRGVKTGGNPGYQTLVLALSNPGERMVRGTGSVQITRADGSPVSRQRFPIDTFLPRTRIDYPLVLRGKALVPGSYRAKVSLDWGSGKVTEPFAFAVSRKNIVQAFGTKGLAQLPGGRGGSGGGGGIVLPIVAGVLALLLGIGGSMLYFRRLTRRLEERLTRYTEADEPRFSQDQDRESIRR